jgi:hypothetical protein
VVAAIILWNTVYLERAIQALCDTEQNIDEKLLPHLSPLGWEHINLTGDYVWRQHKLVEQGKFRPLRIGCSPRLSVRFFPFREQTPIPSARDNMPSKEVSALMNALNLDMADWWEATADYLSHVSKDRILGIVTDAVSPQIAQTFTNFKKAELVAAAEKHLSGLRWLPDTLEAS